MLLRETHAGPRRTAILVYAVLGVVIAVWLGFLRRAISDAARRKSGPRPVTSSAPSPAAAAPADQG